MEQLQVQQSAFTEILVQQGLNFDASVAVFQLRYELGLTQAQLAQRVGCLPQVITGLENGTVDATLPLLKRIAIVTGQHLQVAFEPVHACDVRR